MDKLSKRLTDILNEQDFCFDPSEMRTVEKALGIFAAYENTGLTPKEIEDLVSVREITPEAEYAINKHADNLIERLDKLIKQTDEKDELKRYKEAEAEGRLIVLPCKVGDTVYTNISVQGDRYRKANRPYAVRVVFVGMGTGNTYFHIEYDNGRVFPLDLNKFGKTVFLTREEAEKAL